MVETSPRSTAQCGLQEQPYAAPPTSEIGAGNLDAEVPVAAFIAPFDFGGQAWADLEADLPTDAEVPVAAFTAPSDFRGQTCFLLPGYLSSGNTEAAARPASSARAVITGRTNMTNLGPTNIGDQAQSVYSETDGKMYSGGEDEPTNIATSEIAHSTIAQVAHELSNNVNVEGSETKQLCAIQFIKESNATMTDEFAALKKSIVYLDKNVEEATVNDLCHDEDA